VGALAVLDAFRGFAASGVIFLILVCALAYEGVVEIVLRIRLAGVGGAGGGL